MKFKILMLILIEQLSFSEIKDRERANPQANHDQSLPSEIHYTISDILNLGSLQKEAHQKSLNNDQPSGKFIDSSKLPKKPRHNYPLVSERSSNFSDLFSSFPFDLDLPGNQHKLKSSYSKSRAKPYIVPTSQQNRSLKIAQKPEQRFELSPLLRHLKPVDSVDSESKPRPDRKLNYEVQQYTMDGQLVEKTKKKITVSLLATMGKTKQTKISKEDFEERKKKLLEELKKREKKSSGDDAGGLFSKFRARLSSICKPINLPGKQYKHSCFEFFGEKPSPNQPTGDKPPEKIVDSSVEEKGQPAKDQTESEKVSKDEHNGDLSFVQADKFTFYKDCPSEEWEESDYSEINSSMSDLPKVDLPDVDLLSVEYPLKSSLPRQKYGRYVYMNLKPNPDDPKSFEEIVSRVKALHYLGDNEIFLGMANNTCWIVPDGEDGARIAFLQRKPERTILSLLGMDTHPKYPVQNSQENYNTAVILHRLMLVEGMAAKLQALRGLCMGFQGSFVDFMVTENKFNAMFTPNSGVCRLKNCKQSLVHYNLTFDSNTHKPEIFWHHNKITSNIIYTPMDNGKPYYSHMVPNPEIKDQAEIPECDEIEYYRNFYEPLSFFGLFLRNTNIPQSDRNSNAVVNNHLSEAIRNVWETILENEMKTARAKEVNRFNQLHSTLEDDNIYQDFKGLTQRFINESKNIKWQNDSSKTETQFNILTREEYARSIKEYLLTNRYLVRIRQFLDELQQRNTVVSQVNTNEQTSSGQQS